MVLVIDGAFGEGGGQILRSAIGMAMVTQTAVQILSIRKKRSKPGLLRQHLTAVQAAAEISGTSVDARVGSTELYFAPGPVKPGTYHFSIGTAGSASLVLQTVLPALLTAPEPSVVSVEGGTHNSMSPPFDFLEKTFAPLLRRMGAGLELTLERAGFYPAGGGRIRAKITPPKVWSPLELVERGELLSHRARALVSKLPRSIGERELDTIERRLGWPRRGGTYSVVEVEDSIGPGNVLLVELACEHVTEVVTAFGEKGTRAEVVAERAADEVSRYLGAGVPVGEHLADQLLIPLALAKGGAYRTLPLTEHTATNLEVLRRFGVTSFVAEPADDGSVLVALRS